MVPNTIACFSTVPLWACVTNYFIILYSPSVQCELHGNRFGLLPLRPSFFLVRVCVYMCVDMCWVCVCVVCGRVWRGMQSQGEDVRHPALSTLFFWGFSYPLECLSLDLEIAPLINCTASILHRSFNCVQPCPAFYMATRDLNWDHHVHLGSTYTHWAVSLAPDA